MGRRLVFEERFSVYESPAFPIGDSEIHVSGLDVICSIMLTPADWEETELENAQPSIAKIDSGCNGGLAIREEHLIDWFGQDLTNFSEGTPITLGTSSGHSFEDVPVYDGTVWLKPSKHLQNVEPVRMELPSGFIYFPKPTEEDANDVPRGPVLPLIGAEAFWKAGLIIELDYAALVCRIWKYEPEEPEEPGIVSKLRSLAAAVGWFILRRGRRSEGASIPDRL